MVDQRRKRYVQAFFEEGTTCSPRQCGISNSGTGDLIPLNPGASSHSTEKSLLLFRALHSPRKPYPVLHLCKTEDGSWVHDFGHRRIKFSHLSQRQLHCSMSSRRLVFERTSPKCEDCTPLHYRVQDVESAQTAFFIKFL